MSLTAKSLLIIAITFTALIVFVHLLSESILLKSYLALEDQTIRRNVARAVSAFHDDLDNIDIFLNDWSSWDDTYEFVADPEGKSDYVVSNLVDQSFTNPRHNFILFFNDRGELVRGKAFDLEEKIEVPLPDSLLERFSPSSPFHRRSEKDEPLKGVIALPEGVVMLAARPILTSGEKGPSRGTLVMGRFINENETAKLARITHLDLKLLPPGDPALPEKCRAVLLAGTDPDGIHVHVQSKDRVTGQALLKDLNDRPVLVFNVVQPREIYRQGLVSMLYYRRWLIILGLAAAALTILILQLFVIRPVRRLTKVVCRIGESKELSARIPVSGRDEVSRLARSLNAMLESLENAQAELRKSEARYRGVVEDQTELICRFRPDFTLTFVNEAYCRYFDSSSEEILGRSFLPIVSEEDRNRVAANIAALSVGQPLASHEERVRMPDGSTRWQFWTNRLIGGETGLPVEYQAVGRDITEHKRLEAEILRAQKMESVGTLAGGIAHDFNNILVAILGSLSLVHNLLPGDGKTAELIAEAESATLRARDLARQILTFARGGAPIRKTVALSRTITDASRMALAGSNCAAEFSLVPDLWPVEADESQIGQAVSNLVINASQATPQGGTVAVRAENVHLGEGRVVNLPAGDYVLISIRDRGIGIPEEHLAKIFDPYFTTKQQGSGLGLAIVYSIVKNHGGAVALESKLGEGSVFRVYLPARPGASVAEKAPAAPTRGCGRILLMEDDETVSAVTARMLEHLGYRTETALDGEEMLSAYRRAREENDPFAAVIVDLTVPGKMGGKTAIAELLRLDPAARAIVASGYSSDPVMAEFRTYGFRGVIVKPYDLAELGEALRSVLSS